MDTDAILGILAVLLLMGFGSRRWRADVVAKLADIREDRRLRRKYDF
jgi:hypothetical protein